MSHFQAQLRHFIRAKRRGRLFDHGPFVVTESFAGVSSVVTRGNINCAGIKSQLDQRFQLLKEPTSLLALKTSAAVTADWSDRLPNLLFFSLTNKPQTDRQSTIQFDG